MPDVFAPWHTLALPPLETQCKYACLNPMRGPTLGAGGTGAQHLGVDVTTQRQTPFLGTVSHDACCCQHALCLPHTLTRPRRGSALAWQAWHSKLGAIHFTHRLDSESKANREPGATLGGRPRPAGAAARRPAAAAAAPQTARPAAAGAAPRRRAAGPACERGASCQSHSYWQEPYAQLAATSAGARACSALKSTVMPRQITHEGVG